jgi:uncharacterized protein
MAQQLATPGVFIQEVTGPGVIAGVGTSTAAFIGPALDGPINEARLMTSYDDFLRDYAITLSDGSRSPFITDPHPFYVAHAVRGFYDNGGRFAYVVRVGTAARAFLNLPGRAGTGFALRVEALKEGIAGNNIQVQVADASLASSLPASRPTATVTDARERRIVVDNAANFRPGDIITIDGTTERQTIDRIDPNTNEIFLTGDLLGPSTSGTLRIADLQPGQRTFRLDDTTGLFPGSVVTISRNSTSEPATITDVRGGFVSLESGLTNPYPMTGAAVTVTSHEFILIFSAPGAATETFDSLSMSRRHPRFYQQMVRSTLVRVMPPPTPTTALPPNDRPADTTATPLANGRDDNLGAIGGDEFKAGIRALEMVDDVNFICIPDTQDASVQQDLITHCLNMGDRFAILDAPPGLDPAGALAYKPQVQSERGFAALYYPWVEIRDPTRRNGSRLLVPPSGYVAGVYARVDEQRGVHKAPANEVLRGVLGLERVVTDNQQAPLNLAGVNVLRIFPGQAGPVIWGARTTVDPVITDWVYVNVRRLMLFIEESIQESIRFAVFEPNNLALWQKLKRTISEFLTRVWRDGALFGAIPEEAFYVRVDEALNPPATRALGQLFIEIGVAPVRPAEFVVVRIGLSAGETEVTEA